MAKTDDHFSNVTCNVTGVKRPLISYQLRRLFPLDLVLIQVHADAGSGWDGDVAVFGGDWIGEEVLVDAVPLDEELLVGV